MKKNVLKRTLALLMATMMVLSLAACGGKTKGTDSGKSDTPVETVNKDDGKVYTLQMSSTVNEDHLVTKTDRYFIQRVEELSGGRLKIDFYPNNQLGDPRSMLEATTMGNNDICDVGLPQYSNFTNALKFFSLPFLWETRDAAYAFLSTDTGEAIRKQVEEEAGVHILGFTDDGFFDFTSNKKMLTPADVKGFKIRCQESDVLLQTWTDLGASPLPMSFSEVYTALQQGAIDGQMNGYITNYNSGYYEVQKYIHKVGLLFDVMVVGISADSYYALPEDLQAVLDQAGEDMQKWSIQAAREENQRCADAWVEKGAEIIDMTDPETQALWKEATQPTYNWFRESFPEVDLDAILETVDELNTQYESAKVDEVI